MRRRVKKILILTILIVAALLAAASYFLYSFYVPDEQAEVIGNIRYTDAEIRRMAMPGFKEHNSLYLRFLQNEIRLPDDPFLDSIEVEYLGRDRVRLHANEDYPVGYLLFDGNRYYFNASGIVTESLEDAVQSDAEERARQETEKGEPQEGAPEAEEKELSGKAAGTDTAFRPALEDVSQVTGLTEQEPAVGEQIRAADMRVFRTLMTLGKLINKLNIRPDEIRIDRDQTMALRYGSVMVDLGEDRLLDEKMSRAAAILPQLEGMEGTLHLENFASDTINIVFSPPREEGPEGAEEYEEMEEVGGQGESEEPAENEGPAEYTESGEFTEPQEAFGEDYTWEEFLEDTNLEYGYTEEADADA